MTASLWLAFFTVALVASFSPGPGVLLAVSTTLTLGVRHTFYSSAGNAVGVLLLAGVACSGMGLLLQDAPVSVGVLRIAGATYLAWLGIKQWRRAGQGIAGLSSVTTADTRARAVFLRGLLVACGNPKSLLFFLTVLPQFMPVGQASVSLTLLMSLSFAACTLVAHAVYVLLIAWGGSRFLHGARMSMLLRCMSALFVLLAARMLVL